MSRLIFAFSLFSSFLLDALPYQTMIVGVANKDLLEALRDSSDAISLEKKPPPSLSALRFRAESDIAGFLRVLRSYGYYEGRVSVQVTGENPARVLFTIQPGAIYTVGSSSIDLKSGKTPISLASLNLGLTKGEPAKSEIIASAEERLIDQLRNKGFPMCEVKERHFIADGATRALKVAFDVDSGPPCRFGELEIVGDAGVRKPFILQKIGWKRGETYSNELIETTQKRLMDTGLFSSLSITHGETPDGTGELPMKLELHPAKPRSIHVGVSYQTVFGPGLTFGWEHRNFRGKGDRLAFQGDVTLITHSGLATYQLPNFKGQDQDLLFQLQAFHESITAYHEMNYSAKGTLERRLGKQMKVSGSVRLEHLDVTSSVMDGHALLSSVPFFFSWSSANNSMNPTRGMTLQLYVTPTFNPRETKAFSTQELSFSHFLPFSHKRLVLAQKLTLGATLAQALVDVPVPKRFLGGSEEELRGYKYKTVSPLEGDEPTGGLAAIFYSFEARIRVGESFGLVPFYDTGRVTRHRLPTFTGKWRHDVGLGVRYYSFMGPLRLDVAFPLNRRSGIDDRYKVYVSIGQMF